MNPLHQRIPTHQGFQMAMVFKDTKLPHNELPDHIHDWFELVYVYSGSGVFFIDQYFYDMEAGDCFLIPANTIHRALPNADCPVTSTALFFNAVTVPQMHSGDSFSLMKCFEQAKRHNNYKFHLPSGENRTLETQLDGINKEQQQCSPGYRHAILLHLSQILLLLTRASSSEREDTSFSLGPEWMKEVLAHIDDHLGDDLSLSALAANHCVSPAHLSRTFKRCTGLTITEYVNTKRILKAVELLQTTRQSIAEIALACGIDSLPHFHSTFKKMIGHTPAHFRRQADELMKK
ncbi:AraC family transcriptional regulator [Paenibacillus sp. GD4]|uniref:AraC family transcriptional regulator n=1 Tax=Paenibacillus sp. GD4 TaxID=3068890 RepID=UPI0027967E1F|nr:AraC family transcriptional regulator [Paenibacillus sp. GD4]MDQ1913392.1 AraC family transcriptional regulator [Paenibacillus sp. GD4]